MITQQEYQLRRQALAQRLPIGAVALIHSGRELIRNGDSHYRFRVNSDFYYLTGFNEPDAILIIMALSEVVCVIFNRPHNPTEEQWTGKRLGQEAALNQLAMNRAYSIAQFESKLPEILTDCTAVFYSFAQNYELEHDIKKATLLLKSKVRKGIKVPSSFVDLDPILSELRLIKSENELKLMRQAASLSIAAHQRIMRKASQLHYEYQLEAEFLYELQRHGCRNVAYDSIVASAENACILHYTENNQPLNKNELILIDAGVEFEYYASDITRTIPASGQFSAEQKIIYELVLKAQQAGIHIIKPGVPWNAIQDAIVRVLTSGLVELGILQGDLDTLITNEAYRPFYMHSSGHWLGLDVHDCGLYKLDGQWRSLEPGMVLTVEPGLYISKDMPEVDSRWWGIGVRIEDDILVTAEGNENLTQALPVTVAEIEALMRDK